jgi:3-hydroxyisobutyrate dehydrogenase
MAKVAFIGTGLLGSAIAEGLLRRGDAVTVWNRTASKAKALEALGATVAETAAAAVAGAERVHMTLSDDAAVDGVLTAILPSIGKGSVIVDHTTTSPAGTAARYGRMRQAGVVFVHAPVFMSPEMARNSLGLILCSAAEPQFQRVQDVLKQMTREVWYLGDDPPRAAAFKLFGNSMIFVITAGLTDIFAMAKNLGILPGDAIGVFSKFQAGGIINYRGEKMAKQDYAATFELAMARKDMRLMLEAAGGQPLLVLPAIARAMDEAIARGHGHDDLGAIARVSDPRAPELL